MRALELFLTVEKKRKEKEQTTEVTYQIEASFLRRGSSD